MAHQKRRKSTRTMEDDETSVVTEDVEEERGRHHHHHHHHHQQQRHRHSHDMKHSSSDGQQQQQQQQRRHRRSQSRQRRKHHRRDSSEDTHERMRRYLYSAISATFFFVLLRELGWVDSMQATLAESDFRQYIEQHTMHKNDGRTSSSSTSGGAGMGGIPSLAAAAANMAATSMKMSKNPASGSVGSANGGMSENMLMANPQNFVTRSDMMDHVTQVDHSITPGSRPIMYTFFEWIPPRSRGTSMSDVADKKLITEWRAAWKAAGWHPIVLTLEDAKKHPQYADYAPKLNKIPMLGVDGLGGTVIYNQLCFLRWLAVAAAGGGFLCDYDVFPISRAPASASARGDANGADDGADGKNPSGWDILPFDGNFTVYSRIKHSKRAGIPCLMSGRATEWTRMAYALLENGKKNSGTETMWSDMLALIDMRNDDMYTVQDAVLEGQDVLTKEGWTPDKCNMTTSKIAIHFSHEALKLGYLPPGETAEDRPEIVRRFITEWHSVCGLQLRKTVLGR